ncbi:uncharacterized protein M421DRAFT_385698 [Didymella exigua CBS 183.55]|uniref:Uncharacterized protein n=1 Tax=Didymella exigua CBS 183.55 TaxID=1150837 RepID=A0A6A5RRT2_9PLEO|nr:uncharacterized protein M421DRAFT_385698 [Didymella exigua CBS 183.55]KAF1930153.1 hypothetical protein M421DRAFT_385698 [Didymella exigua CBS 183.55]
MLTTSVVPRLLQGWRAPSSECLPWAGANRAAFAMHHVRLYHGPGQQSPVMGSRSVWIHGIYTSERHAMQPAAVQDQSPKLRRCTCPMQSSMARRANRWLGSGLRQTDMEAQQGRMHVLYWLCVTTARVSRGDDAPAAPHVAQVIVCASKEPLIESHRVS